MSVQRTIKLWCDGLGKGCPNSFAPDAWLSARQVRAVAHNDGWSRYMGVADYCPECTRRIAKESK